MSVLDERIKQRAYEIWESEGRPDGKDEEHWHRAAAEIRGETAVGGEAPNPAPNPTAGDAAKPARTRRPAAKEPDAKPAGAAPKARRSKVTGVA